MENKDILNLMNKHSIFNDVKWKEETREYDTADTSKDVKEFVYSVPSGTLRDDTLQSISIDIIKAIIKQTEKDILDRLKKIVYPNVVTGSNFHNELHKNMKLKKLITELEVKQK